MGVRFGTACDVNRRSSPAGVARVSGWVPRGGSVRDDVGIEAFEAQEAPGSGASSGLRSSSSPGCSFRIEAQDQADHDQGPDRQQGDGLGESAGQPIGEVPREEGPGGGAGRTGHVDGAVGPAAASVGKSSGP